MSGLDLTLLGIIGFGGFIGLSRGFTGEILSLAKLSAASFFSVLILNNIKDVLPDSGMAQYISNGALGLVIFIVCNIALSLVAFQINFVLSTVIPGIINRPFGVLVGAAKMFLILSLVVFAASIASTKFSDKSPALLEESKTKDIFISTGALISKVLFGFDSEKINEGSESNIGDFLPGFSSGSDSDENSDADTNNRVLTPQEQESDNQDLSIESLKGLMSIFGSDNNEENQDSDATDQGDGNSEMNNSNSDSNLGGSINLDQLKNLKDNYDNLDNLLDSLQ